MEKMEETGRREPTGGDSAGGFVQRELRRLEAALRQPQSESAYCQLYAAQQALSWAIEPSGFRSPYDTITAGAVFPPIREDIQAGSEGCPSSCRQLPS
jgi:hypothetical protein